jgi:drug/metabolite transporter (DMT)-like permease
MHVVSGRWKLGLALALVTAGCWGILPLALKLALQGMDPYTITWYRFAVAMLVLGGLLALRGELPSPKTLFQGRGGKLYAIALLGLVGNYVFYLLALSHTTPGVAQTVIQLGPMFLLLGGIIIFKERFTVRQWVGFTLLVLGLLLFFNRRLADLLNLSGGTGLGVALMVIAALTWASYGLAQKQLLQRLSSQQILFAVYVGATLILLPTAKPLGVLQLNGLQLCMLIFACANTLIAYGAFAEALEHWEISRVGAVLAVTPLLTLGSMWLAGHFFPGLLPPEILDATSVCGALLVVSGSAVCALGNALKFPWLSGPDGTNERAKI